MDPLRTCDRRLSAHRRKHCTLKPTNLELDPIAVFPTAVDRRGSIPSETR
jgi:hypothetical protein